MFSARAIAYNPAHERLVEVEVRHEDEEYATMKAIRALKDHPKGAYWASIEIVVN